MGWEVRGNGKRYFYISRREGRRVVKDYYGNGPAAHLAEQQLKARKQQRKADKEAVRAAKEQLSLADGAVDRVARSSQIVPFQCPSIPNGALPVQTGKPLQEVDPMSSKPSSFPDTKESHNEGLDPISRIQTLLERVQQGDLTADSELESLLDQYPDLWLFMGDVGEQAIQAWLSLVSGRVPILAIAAKKKLDALRAELLAGGTDVATRLHADRVMATWLQVTYADARYAQADRTSLPMLEFLARRQKQAQQQHLAALNAWRMWRRAQVQSGTVPNPVSPAAVIPDLSVQTAAAVNPTHARWILPFPSPVVNETSSRAVAGR